MEVKVNDCTRLRRIPSLPKFMLSPWFSKTGKSLLCKWLLQSWVRMLEGSWRLVKDSCIPVLEIWWTGFPEVSQCRVPCRVQLCGYSDNREMVHLHLH